MHSRGTMLRFGLFALFAGHACLLSGFAQSTACPSSQGAGNQQKPETRVFVDQVEFHGDNPLTESQRADLAKKIQAQSFVLTPEDAQDSWAIEATEVIVRGTLQDLGYLKVVPQGTPFLIRATEHELYYALGIEMQSRPQYRLGTVRFVSTRDAPPAFADSLLRSQLELKTGDLFSASKVRLAMENITRLYVSKGYLDMVPEPQTDFYEDDSHIDLTFRIDEGQLYRIRSIDLFAGDATSRQLSLPQSKGEPIDPNLWRRFFEANQSHFIAGAKFDWSVRFTRNPTESAVGVVVDFQACPEPRLPPESIPTLATRTPI